jgi:hypothetical protein
MSGPEAVSDFSVALSQQCDCTLEEGALEQSKPVGLVIIYFCTAGERSTAPLEMPR